MYVLDSLRGNGGGAGDRTENGEFRLLCSGVLYNGLVKACDWTKEDICRILLKKPVVLFVASQPINGYPQELMLRVPVIQAREEGRSSESGSVSVAIFHPHSEVADDLASLLTVLLRRLVVVHSQVCTIPPAETLSGYPLNYWPLPITKSSPVVTWGRRPTSVVTMPDGSYKVHSYETPPVGVDTSWLERVLSALPDMSQADMIISCARLYNQGMQLIEERTEVAYQLFIAAAETLACAALSDYVASKEEILGNKRQVYDRALGLGVPEAGAQELAILAAKGMSWHAKKFKECLRRYTDSRIWEKDDLFHIPASVLPKIDDFDSALSEIYAARGAALHSGKALSACAGLGISTMIPVAALHEILLGGRTLPPVTWFERVVQTAIVSYIEGQLPVPPPSAEMK